MAGEYQVGWKEIGAVFGVIGKRVREWRKAGAPILLLGNKPVARLDDLWYWLLDNRAAAGDRQDTPMGDGMSAAQAKKLFPEAGGRALVAAVLGRHDEAS